jgi:hypothetical protein
MITAGSSSKDYVLGVVTGLLGHPRPGGMGGDPGDVHAATAVLDHDPDVEAAQEGGIKGGSGPLAGAAAAPVEFGGIVHELSAAEAIIYGPALHRAGVRLRRRTRPAVGRVRHVGAPSRPRTAAGMGAESDR